MIDVTAMASAAAFLFTDLGISALGIAQSSKDFVSFRIKNDERAAAMLIRPATFGGKSQLASIMGERNSPK